MRAVIFDLDGTLVDSLDDIAAALGHVLGARGLPTHSREDVERFIGDGARMLVRRALGEALLEREPAREDETLAAFRARYAAHLVVHTKPFDGIPELLAALAERGTPTAVLSNKPHEMTRGVVSALFDHPFVEVLGERAGIPRKPDPRAALELLERLGVAAPDALFVGDTAVDVQTARAAGLVSVGVTWGMRAPEALSGADHVVESPGALLSLLSPPGA